MVAGAHRLAAVRQLGHAVIRAVVRSEDDLDAELQRYAEQTGHSVASIRARLQKDGELGRLAAGLRREKTVAHVMSKAQIKKG